MQCSFWPYFDVVIEFFITLHGDAVLSTELSCALEFGCLKGSVDSNY